MIMRNKIIFIVLFVWVGYKLSAQTLITGIVSDSVNVPVTNAKIENYLEHEHNITCEDQLFIQTDKNKYRPGDTIYFQLYVRNTFSGAFESSSTALYALVFNDQHQVLDSSRFRITNATSPGWLALPNNAKPGIYHFTAFTSLMQNFEPLDAFHLDLKVDAPQNQKMNIEVRLNKDIYHPGDTLEADLKITDSNGKPSSQQYFKSSFIYKNYLIDNDESKTNMDGDSFIRFIIPDSIHFRDNVSETDIRKRAHHGQEATSCHKNG
jgi:uncharacterized protein YfaS (alpha-2-macroglobulin family)